MALFSRNSDKTDEKSAITSVLDENLQITGDLSCKGKVRIDGKVEGNVKVEYLILSESGQIHGDVEAGVVVCFGRIDGNVRAAKFNAKQSACINGRVEVEDLSVEFGASFNGEIKARAQDLRLIQTSPFAAATNGNAVDSQTS